MQYQELYTKVNKLMNNNIIKMYVGICRQEMQRLICSWKLYAGILIYFFMCIFSVISEDGRLPSAQQGMLTLAGFSNLNRILFLMAAFPYAASFCEDWHKRYMNSIVLRSSPKIYITGKLTMCAVSSFCMSFIGLGLYAVFSTYMVGLGVHSNNIYPGAPLYDLSLGSMKFMYVIGQILLFSMVSAVYAVMGLALSAAIPNRFVAVTAPIFMNTVVQQICGALPKALDLYSIQLGNRAYGTSAVFVLCMSFMVCLGYIMLSGVVFNTYAGRRIRNDLI